MLARIVSELHISIDQSEQGVIATHTNLLARLNLRTALAHNDAPCRNQLTIVALHAQHFRLAISTIARATYTFFMCHDFFSYSALVSVDCATGVVVPVVSFVVTSSTGVLGLALGSSPVIRLLPSATMSSILSTVSSWRWPRLWRKRFLDLYRKTITFLPRVGLTAVASTAAFSTNGEPTRVPSASEINRTSPIDICVPSSTGSRFTSSCWPTETLYCRPPL